jgi:predicted PurR-regulated permease PerM
VTSAESSRGAVDDATPRLAAVVAPAATPAAPVATQLERRIRPAQIAVIGLFVIAAMGAIWWAKPFLLPVVASIVLATLLAPIVAWLEAMHAPRALGSLIVIAVVVVLLFVAIEFMLEPLARLLDTIPAMESLLTRLLRASRHLFGEPFADWLKARFGEFAAQQSGAVSAGLFAGIVGGSVGVGTVLLLTFFLLASGDHFLQKLVRVIPRIRDKMNAVRIVRTVQGEVSHYFLTVTIINIALGAVVGLICWYFALPNALLWGSLVTALNYLPYIGPIVNCVLLATASAAHFSSLGEALVVPLLFAGITIIEGQLITPAIVGKRVALNPVVVFAGLLFWGWLWGVPGMMLAIPLLLVAKIWAQHTAALEQWAEFLGPDSRTGDDAT